MYMDRGLDSGEGEKIGEMQIELPEPAVKDGEALKQVKVSVEGKTSSYTVPRFSRIDIIDTFGLPPFSEWAVGVDQVEDQEASFSSGDHSESFRIERKSPHQINFHLDRTISDREENYAARELLLPDSDISLGIYEVNHTAGECNFVIERSVARDRKSIEELSSEKLTSEEKNYLEKRRREERTPDLVVFKKFDITGETPAVQQDLHPFWEKTSWSGEEVRILELGYLDYGDNSTELAERHGRWYKLFSFEGFDHDRLEIREGNWRGREVETARGGINAIENYEKYLYRVD